jgi:hypothetical protein
MEKSPAIATLALALIIVVLMTAPTQLSLSVQSTSAVATPLSVLAPAPSHGTVAASTSTSPLAPALPAPQMTFPRTVLIETFTAVWCIHCPAETQALHTIDENTSRSVIDIAELHVCAFAPGQGPCLENYVPPDGTSTSRGVFYNVCGYPDVFFDGENSACGATNSEAGMENDYNDSIANASAYPGNVSISQTAVVDGGNVTEHAAITSGLTGTYNAVTYLMEYIGKLNVNIGYGPHDVDHVVRETLYNHPVTLTAGETTDISAQGALNTTWNTLNLSVVTFVQENSTRIVENANMVPVTTLTTAVNSNQTTLFSKNNATISVHVANSTTGGPLEGATVNFTLSGGGSISPAGAVTDASGDVSVSFQAPTVTSTSNVVVSAQVSAPDYTNDTGTVTLTVNPVLSPDVPTGLAVTPGNQQVSLNWTIPASGGSGVIYHIYRSSASAGPFIALTTETTPVFADTSVTPGQTYWYQVSAQNNAGFSPNTTAVVATGVTVLTTGLAPYAGWWIFIDSTNFSSKTNATLPLYLPNGYFEYGYGPASYAFLAAGAGGAVTVAGVPLTVTASFAPRYAGLKGSVNPSDAIVTLNGTAVTVSGGSFVDSLTAGIYVLNVTAPGYVGNVSNVTLTPGNISSVSISLVRMPGSSGSTPASSGGLTQEDLIVLVVGAVFVLAAVVGTAMLMSSRGRRPPNSPSGRKGPASPPEPPGSEP